MNHAPEPDIGHLSPSDLDLVAAATSNSGAKDVDPQFESDSQTIKTKRKVNYNQEAVLCPVCKKRIRLNNNGRLRVHMVGKVGSEDCPESNTLPAGTSEPAPEVDESPQEAVTTLLTNIFSGA
jgi:uncharacterized protein YlaI